MKINIKRDEGIESFEVDLQKETILYILDYIKKNIEASLSFRQGCRSGVCGSCSIRVNGVEKLACKTKIDDEVFLEPLKNTKVIKDLIIDLQYESEKLSKAKTYLEQNSLKEITKEDVQEIDKQSNCILCQSCYSSCPVFEFNENFLGPYVLTRVLRYVNDKKEADIKDKIASIQKDGIWDCTLCGNCFMVCPSYIDSKMDIMNLRNKSIQEGYTNPNMQNQMDFSFNNDFGFNPNSF